MRDSKYMEVSSEPPNPSESSQRIVAAERLIGGVLVKFADGQCGFYSEAYLFSKLIEVEQLNEQKAQW